MSKRLDLATEVIIREFFNPILLLRTDARHQGYLRFLFYSLCLRLGLTHEDIAEASNTTPDMIKKRIKLGLDKQAYSYSFELDIRKIERLAKEISQKIDG